MKMIWLSSNTSFDMIKIAVVTSVSGNIRPMSRLTMPNKLEYCLRHDYSLIILNCHYQEAAARMDMLIPLFGIYDMLWTLDCDAVITNSSVRLEDLTCLGDHATVCLEFPWSNKIVNCGSMIWKNTEETKQLLVEIKEARPVWRNMRTGWQEWLTSSYVGRSLEIAPLRSFNSCHHGRGNKWRPGDFVYHPCGLPQEQKRKLITEVLAKGT